MTNLRLMLLLLFMVFVVAGCATPPKMTETRLGLNWGRSYIAQAYLQKANPDAGQNLEPVEGLVGEASSANREKYVKTFAEKQERPVYNINLSGLGE